MPHITAAEKVELDTRNVVKMGDACFLFAKYADETFAANPSWSTVHQIKRALKFPFHNDTVHEIVKAHMGHLDRVDIEVAAELAFTEFYRLIASRYEDRKQAENGTAFPKSLDALFTTPVAVVKRGRGRPRKVVTTSVPA